MMAHRLATVVAGLLLLSAAALAQQQDVPHQDFPSAASAAASSPDTSVDAYALVQVPGCNVGKPNSLVLPPSECGWYHRAWLAWAGCAARQRLHPANVVPQQHPVPYSRQCVPGWPLGGVDSAALARVCGL
jgi:hypothetical protein